MGVAYDAREIARPKESEPAVPDEPELEELEQKTAVWNKQNLEHWGSEGWTRDQIVDEVFRRTGHRLTPAAVSMARARWGLPAQRARYTETLPWRIRDEHGMAKEAQLLRLLGRREAGLELSKRDEVWLDGWIARLEEAGSPVVTYEPNSPDGFYYVPRLPEDGDGWIRRPKGA